LGRFRKMLTGHSALSYVTDINSAY
jgi:hypothetical protein